MSNKFVMSFSAGKDSTLSLYRMLEKGYTAEKLLTTISAKDDRSLIHGVNTKLLNKISDSLQIPLVAVDAVGTPYGQAFENELVKAKNEGIDICAFGDIDIEEHKTWGLDRCKVANIEGIWPLWNEDRVSLVREFVDLGFKAKIKIVNTEYLDEKYLGADITHNFIDEMLSIGVDPAAESGEFHTFVYDGPIFNRKIDFKITDIHRREQYSMLDFII